jgi:hypothetical protein
MKSVAVQLEEMLDKIGLKDPGAAKKIQEATLTVEAKLAAATALLEGTNATPKWRESGVDKLVEEIREASLFFPTVPKRVIKKHNGVLENHYPGKPSAGTGDDSKVLLKEAAMRNFNLTEAEAKIFAEIDGPSFTELIMKEGGGQ